MPQDNIISIENLVFEYVRDEDGAPVRALDGVSLDIGRGSFTSIIGRNGSGKSTLAKNINALLLPSGGLVRVDGYDTRDADVLWEIRRRVGMVFQNPDNQLVSAVVEDDVAFGPENLGIAPDEIRERIRVALDSVDMYDQRKMAPHLLSGGQKQRVAIAGVVAMRPDIIIFDEPTAMLDPSGRDEVMDILAKLNAEGITVILITHFMEETIDSDRLVIMDDGRIAMQGTPAEIFSRGAEIENLGLRLPFAVRIAERLRARGHDVPHDLLTIEALAAWAFKTARGGIKAYEEGSGGQDSLSRTHANDAGEPISPSVTQGNGSAAQSGAVELPLSELPERSGGAGIRVENLTHVYNQGLAYETKALDDISLDIRSGEFVGIIGHTGSGKSTLIQHLNGILKPGEGKIFIGGTDITDKKVKMSDIRKKVGLVFQYPEYQLFDETVLKDVSFGPKNLGLSDEEAAERAREALSMVGLDADEFAERSPFELSGGQKRRVAIAGVIAMQPETLILDEPTAGLDPKAHSDILEMVRSIKERTGSTVILVSHNMNDIAEMSDRIFVMDSGKLVRSGAPDEVFADSAYLTGIGLGLPPATKLADLLAARGITAGRVMLTARDIEDYLGGLIGGGV